MPIKTIIMGAAGRDFHNFNTFFRGNKDYEVVAFTATQIPDIEGRVYPKELAGDLYPSGIPIRAEEELVDLIKQHGVEQVVFAYSDVPHEVVMHKASIVNAAGADSSGLIGEAHQPETHLIPLAIAAALGSGPASTSCATPHETSASKRCRLAGWSAHRARRNSATDLGRLAGSVCSAQSMARRKASPNTSRPASTARV